MGLDALLDVAQSLGARGSSASAGGTGLYMARATCTAQAASPISRWLRRNREWAIRSCSSGRPEACERGRPSAPDRGLLWRPAPREPCGLRHSHLAHIFHLSPGLLRARARVWCEMRSIDEHVDDVEKHVPGVLCEYLGGVNGKKHTKQLHFSDRYYPSLLPSALRPQSFPRGVTAAPASSQTPESAYERPARKHAHHEPRDTQTAPTRCATIADRSIPISGWMHACSGRPEPPATHSHAHGKSNLR